MRSLIKKIVMMAVIITGVLNFESIIVFGEGLMKDITLDNATKCYKWSNGNNAIYGLWIISANPFYDYKLDVAFTTKPWDAENLCMIVDKSESKGKIVFINDDKISDAVKFDIVRDSKEDFHITIGKKTIYMKAAHTNVGPYYNLFMSYNKDKLNNLNDISVKFPVATYYRGTGEPYKENDSLEELEKKCIADSIDANKRGSGGE